MIRILGPSRMAAETLRHADEIRALGLDADPRNVPPIHLIDDLLERIVVPHEHREREPLFGRGRKLIEREKHSTITRDRDDGAIGRADLGSHGNEKANTERAVGAGVMPATLNLHWHREGA